MAALVEAEIPDHRNHDGGSDGERAEPAEDHGHRKAGDDDERDPQLPWPASYRFTEQVLDRCLVRTLERYQQPARVSVEILSDDQLRIDKSHQTAFPWASLVYLRS